MLRTKCILLPREEDDGLRISIMSRHTLNDGRTPDARIQTASFDIHSPILGPPKKLIGAYRRGEVNWDEFARIFREHLKQPPLDRIVHQLIRVGRKRNITLLCIETVHERDTAGQLLCHRRLIAERCEQIDSHFSTLIY